MKIGPDGTVLDKESRQLWHHINSLKRPVEADKQEQAALTASELKYRDIAMTNYRRSACNVPCACSLVYTQSGKTCSSDNCLSEEPLRYCGNNSSLFLHNIGRSYSGRAHDSLLSQPHKGRGLLAMMSTV